MIGEIFMEKKSQEQNIGKTVQQNIAIRDFKGLAIKGRDKYSFTFLKIVCFK